MVKNGLKKNWNIRLWNNTFLPKFGLFRNFLYFCSVKQAYIVHLLLMIGLQYATDNIWMGAFGKFMFIGVVTTIASFVLTWLLRMIPGVKKVL
jgi:hypothetical protein